MSDDPESPLPAPHARLSRPQIMGIVNVTPDSFSDGGRYLHADAAIAHGAELSAAGAQIIDVGGESTRPGAVRVPAAEEQRRVLPVVAGLAERGIAVSIDTMNASTALAAAEAGAAIINDVSGGLADGGMARVAAETGLHFVANHWRDGGANSGVDAHYANVLADVRRELEERVADLLDAGVSAERIILDPGIGFAKTADQNWELLSHLPSLNAIGYPVLIGASRKRFLGTFVDPLAPTADRDAPTATISVLAAQSGVWGLRVHNVAVTSSALDVWEAMQP
ncbi:MAG: dihydropteroate synthase [Microbacteriaceae bacterium]|nr:dihydropteroate synthase [Microbacteriaceae bacterium]